MLYAYLQLVPILERYGWPDWLTDIPTADDSVLPGWFGFAASIFFNPDQGRYDESGGTCEQHENSGSSVPNRESESVGYWSGY